MISVNVVEACPYTVAGTGAMHISHDVLAILAGAIYDKDEWIALLLGTRSENGLEITVSGIQVPLQERSYASCELARPEPLGSNVVGVVHSHHSMGAFFSKTDHDTLNPRFPSSLVVAHVKAKSSEAEELLGFSYQAEGRATLLCGTPGIVRFTVIPTPLTPQWPVVVSPGFNTPSSQVGLYQCPHVTRTQVGLEHHCKTACGINDIQPARAIFGQNSEAFMSEVVAKTERTKVKQWYSNQQNKGVQTYDGHRKVKDYPRVGEYYNPWGDDEYGQDLIRHWGL
jgi:proteasome lid subunit RPN8/RPN11